MKPFGSSAVALKFEQYPPPIRRQMQAIRALIFDVAARTNGVGVLEETLKWGEPAYLPSTTKAGSTVRIDWKPRAPHHLGVFFNCNTDLVGTFRAEFPFDFEFDGNRALLIDRSKPIPVVALRLCIEAAFTYHLRKRRR